MNIYNSCLVAIFILKGFPLKLIIIARSGYTQSGIENIGGH